MSAMRIPVALGALALLMAAGSAPAQPQGGPVVVELFQSQGCSSCPPANANVNAIVDRPDVLALSFGVTYWDNLGWKDTFAKPEYTARQWAYAHGLGHGNVGTPQVVINGRADLVGSDRGALDAAIRRGARPPEAQVTLTGQNVSIAQGKAPAKPADVWLVRYNPKVEQVAIQRGENGGRTLPHRDIVKQLVRLGRWSGAAANFNLPSSPDPALRQAVLVQGADGGPILAAAKG